MKTQFSVLLLISALAGPAAAQEVRISVADKDPATLRADIQKAADTVCAAAYRQGDLAISEMNDCARVATDDGLAQARVYASKAPRHTASIGALASNTVTDGR